ncbi:DNA-binding transcriptional regulator, AcrR family [Saccharopolyspora antimicrobica]|uniref:DNA-binding transcriptional regulator, AcrR family n=1 Tax=Saccharopolyspora antimicrobica TaxID=455193 RepID=A0A1I5IKV5_9PSEU|nr:TetR/AcrR family transcriptional regulator [Saccharopolyspora antimicrobica]RKT84030.1 TetR family transcriptional regulator [Saccharopolyspora antimicrobica]SFO61153.1 DNA-binding transcriptional regulator, AcrR family [Saccharopolyspora antimicrobica]
MAEELHRIANRPPQERADAARNRQRVLTAAAGLFAEHGVDGVTMDAVAQAAGVGKGTVFRRFGDKSGLVVALLDERERELQEAVLSGPPPLGPEAPDKERMLAFLGAYVDYLAEHLELIRLSETAAPGARYRIGAYHFWHRHLAIHCTGAADPDHLAHALLAVVDADLNAALREAGYSWERLRAGVCELAERVLA